MKFDIQTAFSKKDIKKIVKKERKMNLKALSICVSLLVIALASLMTPLPEILKLALYFIIMIPGLYVIHVSNTNSEINKLVLISSYKGSSLLGLLIYFGKANIFNRFTIEDGSIEYKQLTDMAKHSDAVKRYVAQLADQKRMPIMYEYHHLQAIYLDECVNHLSTLMASGEP